MSQPFQPVPASPPEQRRNAHKWIPLAIVALAILVLAAAQAIDALEWLPPAELFLIRFSTVALAIILLFAWFVAIGPASWAVRMRVGVLVLLSAATLFALVGIERVSGDIVPKFRFRWTPRADETLPKASQASADEAVDLARTTPDDYPQFLGPRRVGSLEHVHLDRDWSAHPPKLIWRQPIGAGWSSFAVVGHFAVTQEQRGEEELITCYDIDNGQLLWAHATTVRFSAAVAGIGPRATPTINEGKVYAMGAQGNVHCLDGATGKAIWHHDVVTENDAVVPEWGKSCSPLVYENLIVVSAGGHEDNSLVAYDAETGKLVWSAGKDASSYSSPALMTLCGQPQIVMVNQRIVTAHDPADGRILWRRPWPDTVAAAPNVSQPVSVGDDRILLSKGYGVGSALWQVKHDGNQWSVEQLWKSRNLKTKFTNVVVRDGFAYGLDEDILSCVDIASGKRKWIKGRYNHGQVLLVDDLLLVQSESGEVALVEADPDQYREVARFAAVNGQSWNYPALSGTKLLVRTEQEAACYELPIASP